MCDSKVHKHDADEQFYPGIGVERYTPVFQTGIQGALP